MRNVLASGFRATLWFLGASYLALVVGVPISGALLVGAFCGILCLWEQWSGSRAVRRYLANLRLALMLGGIAGVVAMSFGASVTTSDAIAVSVVVVDAAVGGVVFYLDRSASPTT